MHIIVINSLVNLVRLKDLNRGYNLRKNETGLALPKHKTNFSKRISDMTHQFSATIFLWRRRQRIRVISLRVALLIVVYSLMLNFKHTFFILFVLKLEQNFPFYNILSSGPLKVGSRISAKKQVSILSGFELLDLY